MKPCMVCKQPIPDGQEYPQYFAQSNLRPDLSTRPDHARDELGEVLRYTEAVSEALFHLAGDADNSDMVCHLSQLAHELVMEARRRAQWLYVAGQHWRDQAEAATPEAPDTAHAARKGG
jgi:hypothetical protein